MDHPGIDELIPEETFIQYLEPPLSLLDFEATVKKGLPEKYSLRTGWWIDAYTETIASFSVTETRIFNRLRAEVFAFGRDESEKSCLEALAIIIAIRENLIDGRFIRPDKQQYRRENRINLDFIIIQLIVNNLASFIPEYIDVKVPIDPAFVRANGQPNLILEDQADDILNGIVRQRRRAARYKTSVAHIIFLFRLKPFTRSYFISILRKMAFKRGINLNAVHFLQTSNDIT